MNPNVKTASLIIAWGALTLGLIILCLLSLARAFGSF